MIKGIKVQYIYCLQNYIIKMKYEDLWQFCCDSIFSYNDIASSAKRTIWNLVEPLAWVDHSNILDILEFYLLKYGMGKLVMDPG